MATKYTVTELRKAASGSSQGHSVMFVDVPLDLSLFQPTAKRKAKKTANAKGTADADAQKNGGK